MPWIVLAVVLVAAVVLLAGRRSLDPDVVRERLADLPKNAALSAFPLSTAEFRLARQGGALALELTWLRLARPGAPRLVLVHGTPGTLYNWSRLVAGGTGLDGQHLERGLVDDFDLTLVELPGHGLSRDSLEHVDFALLADALGELLAHLDLGPVTLVAHSYGGEAAWRLALDRPELLSDLVLVDSAGQPRADDEWLPEEVKLREWSVAGWGWLLNSPERVHEALVPHFRGPVPDELSREFFLSCAHAGHWRAMMHLARDENGSRADELPLLTVPTLLVWGADDVAYPVERFARRFLDAIPGAELELIEDCGHYPHEERPAALAALLRQRFANR